MEVLSTNVAELHELIHKLYHVIEKQAEVIENQKTIIENQKIIEEKYAVLQEKYATLEERYHTLEEKYQLLLTRHQRKQYGQSSERQKITKLKSDKEPAHTKGRQPLSKDLRRETIEYDLSEAEKVCSQCQNQLHEMGQLKSEQLDHEAMQLKVIEHVQKKYACRKCGSFIKLAPKPESTIAKGIATPALLAHVMMSKYEDHLPLHRQEKIFSRFGVRLSRSTLCDWIGEVSVLLKSLKEAAKKELKQCKRIHTDDTPIPVQTDERKGKTHTGRLWVYIGCEIEKAPIILYEYTKTRSHEGPKNFLEGYSGPLQADAYAGYNILYQTGNVIEIGCWAHARRKFYEVAIADSSSEKAKETLNIIGSLYQIESEIKLSSIDERKKIRQGKAIPILNELRKKLEDWAEKVLPKGPLGLAIRYTLKNWIALTRYCEDGFVEIDNNMSERAIKPVVLGRTNWLFAGSHQGAENAAMIYSLIESCKASGINTYEYFCDVLTRLPAHPINRVHELLPWHWKKSPPEALTKAA